MAREMVALERHKLPGAHTRVEEAVSVRETRRAHSRRRGHDLPGWPDPRNPRVAFCIFFTGIPMFETGKGSILAAKEEGSIDARRANELLKAGALQNAILTSANFSIIATDEKGIIQLFNVGAERMLGYRAAEVVNK